MSELYTIREVAAAADVPAELILRLADSDQILMVDGLMREADAVALLRSLRDTPDGRPPLSPLVETRRRGGLPLAASGTLHVLVVVVFVIASSLGLLNTNDTDTTIPEKTPVRMVYMMTPGPGGGGGGGGLQMPAPPPRAERKAPVVKKTSSPVPPPRPYRPPPRPVTREVVTPPPRPAPPPVQAPVVPDPGDAQEVIGVIDTPPAATPTPPSAGPGTGGGVGTGQGTGIGEGDGTGIGAGSGGGTGGGPFRPGSGIEPPQLLREVRPIYTDDARRRAIEGEVVMEIVVRRDGSVGDVRVLQTLGSGLEQRAIAAVRQWKFSPARRMGSAVDVMVEVAVGFTLR
ncbi:MAG: energy transducer TonB [Acidobacteria bacterium]|nr:energy transducer TonB [Acidobacteriota bacterium]